MISRGHRLADLKDGYTLAQIRLFSRAGGLNRRRERLEEATAVYLGIAQAFNAKEPILTNLRKALEGVESSAKTAPPISAKTEAFFQGSPVKGLKK